MAIFTRSGDRYATVFKDIGSGVGAACGDLGEAGRGGAAVLSPLLQDPSVSGAGSVDGLLSSDSFLAPIEGDLQGPSLFGDPALVLPGVSLILAGSMSFAGDVEASLVISGVDGGFGPEETFLSGALEDFGYEDSLVTLVFGDLAGQAASLLGSRVLVSLFGFDAPPAETGGVSGPVSHTIRSIVTVPLPLTGGSCSAALRALVFCAPAGPRVDGLTGQFGPRSAERSARTARAKESTAINAGLHLLARSPS